MLTSPFPVAAILGAVPSSDLGRSEVFYEASVRRAADERPMPGLAQWRWDGGVLKVVEDPGRAGGGLVSIVVADMSEAVAGLRHRGLRVDAATGSVVAQVTMLADADGNQVTLVETR